VWPGAASTSRTTWRAPSVSTEDTSVRGARYGVVDVHYPAGGGARAALIVYRDEIFRSIVRCHVAALDDVAPYRPGNFYERELPAIRAVLAMAGPLEVLVVDGYVDLDPQGRPGLGAHVREEFGVPVIGVAKSTFRTATHARPVRRGSSKRPLYVTAAGLPVADAATIVARMDTPEHRIPTALGAVDRLCRSGRSG
jgi:deoxyribonuclease V